MTIPLGKQAHRVPWYLFILLMLGWLLSKLPLVQTQSLADVADTKEVLRPNILMLVADDLGYNDTGIYQTSDAPTPAINALAKEGVRFSRHYAHATCSPSRVAMLTGRQAERFGFRHSGMEIPPEVTTLPEALKTLGYSTHLVGKWHAGEIRRESLPLAQGFDSYFGFHNQWELGSADITAVKGYVKPTYINPYLRDGELPPKQYEGHLTDLLAEKTRALIKSKANINTPWFIYHGFLAPHAPIQPAARFAKHYAKNPEGKYLALLAQFDAAVSDIMRTLKESGQDKNTLVIVVSDNGGTSNERDNNHPFYGRKNESYEGSFRTPLVLYWPGQLPATQVDEKVMNTDIYPTVLALLGEQTKEILDGISVLPVLSGQRLPLRSMSWEQYQWNINALTYSFLSDDGRWRMSSMFGLKPTLYNLDQEARGERDMAFEHSEKVADLQKQYRTRQWELAQFFPHLNERDGSRLYTGWDMQRTPLYHGLSLGFAFEGERLPSQDMAVLARQEGLWRLELERGHKLVLTLGDQKLHGGDLSGNTCHEIVLTGNFQPSALVAPIPEAYRLKLYVNGQLRDILKKQPKNYPRIAKATNATEVNYGGKAVFSTLPVSTPNEVYYPEHLPQEHQVLFQTAYQQDELEYPRMKYLSKQLCGER